MFRPEPVTRATLPSSLPMRVPPGLTALVPPAPRTGWYHRPIVSAASDLDSHRYVSLATFRRNGAEVATPVWFAALGGRLYVVTSGDSGKVKRLRNTPNARVAPSNARGRVQGATWQPATARLITDPQLIDRARAA